MINKYETSQTAVKIWFDENATAPGLLQPTWPDGTPWATKAEATSWALAYIEAITDLNSEFLPGDSPVEPLKLRPAMPVELIPEKPIA